MLARKALAGTAGAPKVYVEDVFSTYLYTGTGANLTITNNIDLSTEGGLVWLKKRGAGTGNHQLYDTVRGATNVIYSDLTNAQASNSTGLTSFSSNGFSIGTSSVINGNGDTQVAWTFRKAKKFFDIVTYTGNGTNGRTISHNLGSTPGCIIVKSTSGGTSDYPWMVYHRSLGATKYLVLNNTTAATTSQYAWNNTEPTSTVFSVSFNTNTNENGSTYVAYLFAHDAGGFGLTGSDNVISCGSYTNNSSAPVSVNLGWEPQWILVKVTSGTTGGWQIVDNMRGINYGATKPLAANDTAAEGNEPQLVTPTATGFDIKNNVSANFNSAATTGTVSYIYIAIRRGPMKTPTTGTSVYNAIARTGTGAVATVSGVGFAPDLYIGSMRTSSVYPAFVDRLRGNTKGLASTATAAETTSSSTGDVTAFGMDGISLGTNDQLNFNINTVTAINWFFRRAPGFFDVVCYTGTGSATTFSHNLGVAPELIILKRRDAVVGWAVYNSSVGNTKWMQVNTDNAPSTASTIWNDTSPTSSVFSVGTSATVNASGGTYVAYLFASVSGVSKVGSYTGNGSSVTVTTGFQPRFVMVKRYDSTGDWIVSDSARGLVAGSDPYLLLNSSAVEDTDEDWVDITSTSFTVNQTSSANANVNTGTYIYLAIA